MSRPTFQKRVPWARLSRQARHTSETLPIRSEIGSPNQIVDSRGLHLGCAKMACDAFFTFVKCAYVGPGAVVISWQKNTTKTKNKKTNKQKQQNKDKQKELDRGLIKCSQGMPLKNSVEVR